MAMTGTAKLRFRLLKQSKNQVNRNQLVHQLTQAVLAYLKKNLNTLSGRTLANTLRSLADIDPSGDNFAKMLEATGERLRKHPEIFNTLERCMVVGIFASQRIHPGYLINESVNRVRLRRNMSSCLGLPLLSDCRWK
jgi:hypothetical protein